MFANATEIFESLLRDLLATNNMSEEQMEVMAFELSKRLSMPYPDAVALVGKMLMLGTCGEKPS